MYAVTKYISSNFLLDLLTTLQRMEKLQASFIVWHRPSESVDIDWTRLATRPSVAGEESKEFLDDASELLSAPLMTQTGECWQRHADEDENKAVGSSYHQQTCLIAKRT